MSNASSSLNTLASAAKASAIALYARPSASYAAKHAQAEALLRRAAALGDVTQANSLGVEDMVITDMIRRLQLPIGVFVLETGRLHTETLALLERTQALVGINVQVFRPQHEAVIHFIRTQGQDAIYDSVAQRKHCCDIRKMEPLARALAGKKAWITGLRREQSQDRADVPFRDRDAQGRAKYYPLADWSLEDIWHYVQAHDVPYNELHDRGYPSIGCQPCTRATVDGEDERAGRWWWELGTAKECGLHSRPPPVAS